MDTKHEALELADWLEGVANFSPPSPEGAESRRVYRELRRQHARIEELAFALKGAANYIDKLGGVSQSYRIILNKKD